MFKPRNILRILAMAGLIGASGAVGATPPDIVVDGVRFDGEVGAACGLLTTEIYFEPLSAVTDIHDEPNLDAIASCMLTGALADATITVVGYSAWDVSALATEPHAWARATAAARALMLRGVTPDRLTIITGESQAAMLDASTRLRADRVEFWLTAP